MKVAHFIDEIAKLLETGSQSYTKKFWKWFCGIQIKLTTVLIIVGSVSVLVVFTILFGSTLIASAKFDAEKQTYVSKIADLENNNKEYRDQYQTVLKIKDQYRSSIEQIVETLYNKHSYLGVGGPTQKVADTDEAVLLQIRDTVNTMQDDQKMLLDVKSYLDARKDFIDNFPFVWPTVKTGSPLITSGFGFRPDPFSAKKLSYHTGIDIAGDPGDAVYATAEGVVESTNINLADYGNLIIIKHKYSFETFYAHLSKISVVVGQTVKRGDKIGEIGTTGESTGPHLHYEIRKDGVPIDPMTFLNVNY